MGVAEYNWNFHMANGRCFMIVERFSLDSGSDIEVVFINPAGSGVEVGFRTFGFYGTAEGLVDGYPDPEIMDSGTTVTPVNKKIGHSNTSNVIIEHSGTYNYSTAAGIHPLIPGGSSNFRSGGEAASGLAYVINAGHGFVAKMTNDSSSSGTFGILYEWWEV